MCDLVNHTCILKRITYQTEYVGTNTVINVIVYVTNSMVQDYNSIAVSYFDFLEVSCALQVSLKLYQPFHIFTSLIL
jgi:hypothetical protein